MNQNVPFDDNVVVAVVRELVVRDEPQPVRLVVARLLDRLVAALGGDRAVLVAHRARDPRHVVVRDQAAQRGHEPAAAAPDDPLARCRRGRRRAGRGSRRRSACGARSRRESYRAPPKRSPGLGRLERGALLRTRAVGGVHRKHEREARRARHRAELEAAAHQRRKLARDREAEAAARGDRAVEAVEALEHVRLRLGLDPGPVVGDAEPRDVGADGRRDLGSGCPDGVCTIAFSIRIRPICSTRSSSPSAGAASGTSTSSECPLVLTRGPNSVASSSPSGARSRLSTVTESFPASSRERSSRSVASFVSRVTCAADRDHEVGARLGVELLARQQLEEAREREQRRPQLVRGVGDELGARTVERREPHAHALERARELPELVRDRCRRSASSNSPSAMRAAARVEPADAAREQRREAVAEHEREHRRERARERACACARRPPTSRSFWSGDVSSTTTNCVSGYGDLGVAAAPSRVTVPCAHAAPRPLASCSAGMRRAPARATVVVARRRGELPCGGLESEYGVRCPFSALEDDDARLRERLRPPPRAHSLAEVDRRRRPR